MNIDLSSISDAKSLRGGILLQTPLQGANNTVYAVAQGKLSSTEETSLNTVGFISNGAIVEKEITSDFVLNNTISLILDQPDFTQQKIIVDKLKETFTNIEITTDSPSKITMNIPNGFTNNIFTFISQIENLKIPAAYSNKVIINPRTGVVVMGKDVKIGSVAVSYKGLEINIGDSMDSGGTSESIFIEDLPSVQDFVSILQKFGITTDILIEILLAIENSGALYGQIELM